MKQIIISLLFSLFFYSCSSENTLTPVDPPVQKVDTITIPHEDSLYYNWGDLKLSDTSKFNYPDYVDTLYCSFYVKYFKVDVLFSLKINGSLKYGIGFNSTQAKDTIINIAVYPDAYNFNVEFTTHTFNAYPTAYFRLFINSLYYIKRT